MNDFLLWLKCVFVWGWYQIGGWVGALSFVGGTAVLSVLFAHLFKRAHDWGLRRGLGSYAPLIKQFKYDPVKEAGGKVEWWHALGGESFSPDVQDQAARLAAECWARYSEREEEA